MQTLSKLPAQLTKPRKQRTAHRLGSSGTQGKSHIRPLHAFHHETGIPDPIFRGWGIYQPLIKLEKRLFLMTSFHLGQPKFPKGRTCLGHLAVPRGVAPLLSKPSQALC